jgi:hypothetical protein
MSGSAPSWRDDESGGSELDLEVVVVRVVPFRTAWRVQSSHGDPGKQNFPTRDQAKAYAVRHAKSLIERTISQLDSLADTDEAPTNGWQSRALGLITLHVPPGPHFIDDSDGEVIVEVFEDERARAIDAARARLRSAATAAAGLGRGR